MTDTDSPPYPKARSTYRILGLIHAPLFGALVAKQPFLDGEYLIATIAFLVVGAITVAVFWHIANEHYQGNVAGKPGSPIKRGGDGE